MKQDLILTDICKSYGEKHILENLSAIFPAGQVSAVMAPSGGGKTTLLRIIMGLEQADSGTISGLQGQRISVVFQEDRLCENLDAATNIRLPSPGLSYAAALDAMRSVGLDDCENQPVSELSGGMRRRTAILRALLFESEILLLDEPFKGLDDDTEKLVIADAQRRWSGRTVILVTHDHAEAEALCGDKNILYL